MKQSQYTVLAVSLATVFSTMAYADDEPIAGRIPLSLDNHAQQAAEEVRKINAAYFSGSLNDKGIATQATDARNDSAFSGSLNIPADLQVKGYQPEINQSYDLQSNSNYVLPVSNTANAVNWQIDDSYALENNHFSGSLNNVFQQDKDTVLLAENTVTDTATDANSGSLKESSANGKEIATTASQSRNDDNHQDSSLAIQNDDDNENTQNQDNQEDNIAPVATTATIGSATKLDDITVSAQRQKSSLDKFTNKIVKRDLERQSTGGGDLGSALRTLPNVQYSNSANSSNNPGDIGPTDFSISGGRYYENAIFLDGMRIDSQSDPAQSGAVFGAPPGQSQQFNVDISLVDSIEVRDMNLGGRYSNFGGGSAEYKLKDPEKDLAFKLSQKYTMGNAFKGFPHSLTKYHYDDANYTGGFANAWSDFGTTKQPEYYKWVTTATGEMMFNDNLGAIFQVDRTLSKTPLYLTNEYIDDPNYANYVVMPLYNKFGAQQRYKVKPEQESINVMGKVVYNPSEDLKLSAMYLYSPNSKRSYYYNPQTYTDTVHGGHAFSFDTEWNNSYGLLKNNLNIKSTADEYVPHGYKDNKGWKVSESKNWGTWGGIAYEGGYIPSKTEEKSITNTLSQEFKPFQWGKTEHKVEAGLELSLVKSAYKIKDEFWRYYYPSYMTQAQAEDCKKTNMEDCDPAVAYVSSNKTQDSYFTNTSNYVGQGSLYNYWDPDGISTTKECWDNPYTGDNVCVPKWLYGQYFRYAAGFQPAKIGVSNKKLGIWLQDEIKLPLKDKQWGELTFRPAVRFDRDTFLRNNNIAPRMVFGYEFPWNFKDGSKYATDIQLGLNRYYSANILATYLREGRESLQTTYRRDDPSVDFKTLTRECVDNKDKNCVVYGKNDSKFDHLKTPYTDEIGFGLKQTVGNWEGMLKLIHREGKDQVMRTYKRAGTKWGNAPVYAGFTDNYYYFTNDAKSYSDIVSLEIKNKRPIELWGVKNDFKLSFDWTNTRNKQNDYTTTDAGDIRDFYIMYQGQIMPYSQRPVKAQNFTKPYTIKLNTNHNWNMLGGNWNLNNTFTYTARWKTFQYTGEYYKIANYTNPTTGQPYRNPDGYQWLDYYDILPVKPQFTWDMKFGAEYDVYKKNKLFFNVDVYNLLNRKNESARTRTGTTYKLGRQIWFELGYKYH